jgi:ElaA protein
MSTPDGLVWRTARLDTLNAHELYALLRLRQQVFVVEQACVYPDLDGLDAQAVHLAAWQGDTPLAYLRLLDPGVKFAEPSLGRIVCAASCRGRGLGQQLVAEGLKLHQALYPGQNNRIAAQTYLLRFYGRFGFVPLGEAYDEDGIPHQDMCWHAPPHPAASCSAAE